jgi:hypothetical protein
MTDGKGKMVQDEDEGENAAGVKRILLVERVEKEL